MFSKLDTLGRRKRTYSDRLAGRQPIGKHIAISKDDLNIFEALDHWGVLSSKVLFEFWPGKDWNTLQKRLTKLYNGVKPDPKKPGITYYLEWPPEQKQSHNLRSQHYVYSLAERGRQELENADRHARYIGIRSDPIKHRNYTGTAMASLFLGAARNKASFLTRSDIFAHPNCPQATKASTTPLKVTLKYHSKRKAIEPDELFGFDFGPSKRFHVWETDLGTESITRTGHGTTFEEKLEGYIEMIERGLFKEVYGIPRATAALARDALDCFLAELADDVWLA